MRKGSGFGDRRKEMLVDIATLTGGQVVSSDLGMELKEVGIEVLGRARQVKVNKENTIIVDGAGNPDDIKARIKQIQSQIEITTSEYDKEKLQERLAKLSGGVAVIKVGAATETEMKERSCALRTRSTQRALPLRKVLCPAAEPYTYRPAQPSKSSLPRKRATRRPACSLWLKLCLPP